MKQFQIFGWKGSSNCHSGYCFFNNFPFHAICRSLLDGYSHHDDDLHMLGWGLNIVIGLAGLLDLGYVAFYAVGAYSYALFAIHFGWSFGFVYQSLVFLRVCLEFIRFSSFEIKRRLFSNSYSCFWRNDKILLLN